MKMLAFIRKYHVLILLSLIHPLLIETAEIWRDIGHVGRFDLYEIYCLKFSPLLHFLYGIIFYRISRRLVTAIGLPLLINLSIFGAIYFESILDEPAVGYGVMCLFVFYPFAFLLISATVMSAVGMIRTQLKEYKSSNQA